VPGDMLDERFIWDGHLEEVPERAVACVERFKIQNALQET
jgi:hypothetical protein